MGEIDYELDCFQKGELIFSHPFRGQSTVAAAHVPDRKAMEEEAKVTLANFRLAFPPWDGLTFNLRRVGP